MRILRGIIPTTMLMLVLVVGTTFANTGIVVAGAAETTEPCTVKVDSGIVVAGITGIVVAGFTGIVVAGFTGIVVAGATDTQTDCGIVVAG